MKIQFYPIILILAALAITGCAPSAVPTQLSADAMATQIAAQVHVQVTLAAVQAGTEIAVQVNAQSTQIAQQADAQSTQAAKSTQEASVQQTQAAPSTTGSISGSLSYPSEFIPPLRIVAIRLEGGAVFHMDTAMNQASYQLGGLPAGTYQVIAYLIDGGDMAAGYSQAVPCGLTFACTDHSLAPVTVVGGQDTPNINPGDWYAPPGSFPPNPIP